jgi:RNA polymerase sigma-70 factor (ECF subfamily)
MQTDADLIARARDDLDAFARLYERHVRAVYSWLRIRTDDSAASELTAETFAEAALSLKRFRDEADGSARPWLLGIARNLLRRSYERERIARNARRRLGMPIRSYELDLEALVERADAERLSHAVSSAVGELPASQRKALELRVVNEMSYSEVAESLGSTELAARLRVMRALASLSRLLKGVAL